MLSVPMAIMYVLGIAHGRRAVKYAAEPRQRRKADRARAREAAAYARWPGAWSAASTLFVVGAEMASACLADLMADEVASPSRRGYWYFAAAGLSWQAARWASMLARRDGGI